MCCLVAIRHSTGKLKVIKLVARNLQSLPQGPWVLPFTLVQLPIEIRASSPATWEAGVFQRREEEGPRWPGYTSFQSHS